ncbi:MAG: hypothetical protein OEZ16_06195 [Chromatiales bacterium]|nr:hypothetical protein [Chromatiales bacterium]
MNNSHLALLTLLASTTLFSACQQEVEPPPATSAAQPNVVDLVPAIQPAPSPAMANGLATGTVVETLEAAGYTYVKVDVGGQELWAAGPVTPLNAGDTITFSTLIPMKNFHSKAMNRDFETLYFVDGFSTLNSAGGGGSAHGTMATPAAPAAPAAKVENIAKIEGGYTIAEALSQSKSLAGKPIKVRGQVTKYTPGIMRKNWIHLEDGSGDKDLIVTTTGTAAVGSVIVAEGALSLDRDFGMGYFYEVLMEDATVTAE